MKKLFLCIIAWFTLMHTTNAQVIISQYYEGSSNNKWIEITNLGALSVDLSSPQLYLCLFSNAAADAPSGISSSSNIALSGNLASGESILFQHSSAILPSYASGSPTGACNFNGDDLIIISTSTGTDSWTNRIDVIGNGDTWGENTSFYRISAVSDANSTYTSSEWTEVSNTTVDNASTSDTEYLGTHVYSSSPSPTITVSVSSLTSFNYEFQSGPSSSQSFILSGSNLSSDITIQASTNFEISDDNSSFQSSSITVAQSNGSVASTDIYIRLKAGLTVATYDENITISSSPASDKTINCSGEVTAAIASNIVINEIDADNYSTDYLEFIELYDGGTGNTDLSGLVLVLFNGNNNLSYSAIDLDGESTDNNGYYVIGSSQVANVDNVQFTADDIQNGADAIALYEADASDYPNGTAISTTNLIDAIVYDTDDADDSELLVLLNSNQVQLNENALGAKDYQSLQRISNGSGGQRNSSSFALAPPTPGTKNFDEIWDGETSTSWADASNWLYDIPSSAAKVYIPSGLAFYPDLTATTSVHEITIEHGAQLNGQENLNLGGQITVNHQITKSTDSSNLDHWQYFTSPFSNTTASSLLSSNDKIDIYLAAFDNTSSANNDEAWSFISSASSNISPGIGFALTHVQDNTEAGDDLAGSDYNMAFTGDLLDVSTSLSVNLVQGLSNWNLIGNSYLAPINWFNDTNLNHDNIQGKAAYIYNPSTGSYITITSTGSGNGTVSPSGSALIPPLQGFFVEALANGTFNFDLSARTNSTKTFYKSEPIDSRLILQVQCEERLDETVLIINPNASHSFDEFDAHKLISQSTTPQFYSKSIDNEKLVVNHIPGIPDELMLSVETRMPGTYTISIIEKLGTFEDKTILIIDSQNITHNLSSESYTFNVQEDNEIYNFHLSVENNNAVPRFKESGKPILKIDNGSLSVNFTDANQSMLSIYNLQGQRLLLKKCFGQFTTIAIPKSSEVLLLQITSMQQTYRYKIINNQLAN